MNCGAVVPLAKPICGAMFIFMSVFFIFLHHNRTYAPQNCTTNAMDRSYVCTDSTDTCIRTYRGQAYRPVPVDLHGRTGRSKTTDRKGCRLAWHGDKVPVSDIYFALLLYTAIYLVSLFFCLITGSIFGFFTVDSHS